MGLPSRTSLGDFLRVRLDPAPLDPVKLAGGVAVFCDPNTWPQVPLRLEQGWVRAEGDPPQVLGSLRTPLSTGSTNWCLIRVCPPLESWEWTSSWRINCTPVKSLPCDGHSSLVVLTSLWSCTFGMTDWIGFTPGPIVMFWES